MCLGGEKCVPTDLLLDSREVCFSGQPALKAAIGQYIIVTNTKPNFFRWTKIADDILTSVVQLFLSSPFRDGHKTGMYTKNARTSTSERLSMTPHTIIAGKET